MKQTLFLMASLLLLLTVNSCQSTNNRIANNMKERINTSNAPAAIGPYSQAIDSGHGLIFVSGQLPIDPVTGAIREKDKERDDD